MLRKAFSQTSVWVYTALIMAMVVCGRIIGDDMRGGWLRSVLYVVVFSVVAFMAAAVVFAWFDRMDRSPGVADAASDTGNAEEHATGVKSGVARLVMRWRSPSFWLDRLPFVGYKESVRRYGPWLFLILIVCWLPWFLVCWPGVMRDDTIAQFMQSSGNHPYYVQHPLFDTLVFALFWRAGEATGHLLLGLGLYTVAQAVTLAACAALIVCYLRKLGAPRSLLLAAMLYFAFDAAVVGGVPTMAKDSLHTVFMMPLAIIFVEACLTRGKVLERMPVFASAIALIVLCALSKRTSTVLVICAFMVLIILSKGRRVLVGLCLIIALFLAQGVAEPVMEQATHAEVSPSKEIMALVMQPVSRVQHLHPERINGQERQQLAGAIDLPAAGEHYADYRTDETAWFVNPNASTNQKIEAIKAWATVGLRNPGEYIKAYGNVTLGWFYPRGSVYYGADSEGLFTAQYMQQWGTFVRPPATAEQVLEPMRGTDRKPAVALLLTRIFDVLSRVHFFAVYATYVPLLLLVYGVSRRRWASVTAGSMLGFSVLVLYLSPLAFTWYVMPVCFMLPLFVGVTAAVDE